MELRPWRKSGLLTPTRTYGDVGIRRNGSMLDIWIRVNGSPSWFAVNAESLQFFLSGHYGAEETILPAESDGNAEGEG